MAAGESRRARFELEVKAPMKARLVELGLEVVDTATGGGTGIRSVELPIFPNELPARKARTGVAAFPNVPMPLHAGASRDAALIGEAQPAAVLEVAGQAGDWLALRFDDERPGLDKGTTRVAWVPLDRVRVAESGGVTRDGVATTFQFRPPIVTLPSIPSFISETDLPLEGVARFSGTGSKRRLIYIFRERDKVFFLSGDGAGGRETSGSPRISDPRDGNAELGFSTSIPLEVGKNDITVVAREGDSSVTRTTFTVYRLQ